MACSPAVRKTGKTVVGSCYTPNILEQLRQAYNRGHKPSNQITTTNPEEIWRELRDRLSHCDKEDCWLTELKDEQTRKRLERYIFAPDKPYEWKKNPTTWLSNYDILNVLEQYEEAHPEFEFLGPTPIDFDTRLKTSGNQCVTHELCAFSLAEHKNQGKTKIGIVFNLDKHNEPGSHWVSMFVDADEQIIFYFDSANSRIPAQIHALIERIQQQLVHSTYGRKYKYYRNSVSHQQRNTECGVYSLFFIITMLTKQTEIKQNMSLKERLTLFMHHRIPDKYIETYRNKYFNGGDSSTTTVDPNP